MAHSNEDHLRGLYLQRSGAVQGSMKERAEIRANSRRTATIPRPGGRREGNGYQNTEGENGIEEPTLRGPVTLC